MRTDTSREWLIQEADRRGLARLAFTRGRAGHLTVDGRVEGTSVRLILDTGASRTFLDRVAAQSIGVRAPTDLSPAQGCGAGAGGDVAMSFAQVSEFSLAEVQLNGLEIGLLDLGGVNEKLSMAGDPPVDGVLGGDVLRSRSAIVDLMSESLFLRP